MFYCTFSINQNFFTFWFSERLNTIFSKVFLFLLFFLLTLSCPASGQLLPIESHASKNIWSEPCSFAPAASKKETYDLSLITHFFLKWKHLPIYDSYKRWVLKFWNKPHLSPRTLQKLMKTYWNEKVFQN